MLFFLTRHDIVCWGESLRPIAFAGALILVACTHAPDEAEAAIARHRNLGKAYYENPTTKPEAVKEFEAALKLAPDSTREKLNYALALLRVEGRETEAVKLLEEVQRADPSLPHTWFNLGIYYKRQGDTKRAREQFEGMVAKAPDEPIGHFQLGLLYRQTHRIADARSEFDKAADLDPQLAAARFQLYSLTHALNYLADFQRIQAVQKTWVVPEDPAWSSYAEIYDPHPGRQPAEVAPAKKELPSGLDGLHGVIGFAPGDFDNDGLMDLCVLIESGPLLYRNVGGKFVRQAAKLPARRFDAAVWIDYDHDSDLDLLLLGPEPALMRNQGAAGWSDQTADFPFIKGTVTEARKLRVDSDSKGFDLAVLYRDHAPVLYRDLLGGHYKVEPFRGKLADGNATKGEHWIGVQLKGVRSPKLAQDALVEIKAGTLYRSALYDGTPLTFDLGDHTAADVVRITWPNGLIQNEVQQAGNQTHVIEEAQRLSGSCPMIWSWDGREFRFVTDVLGVAPLGARDAGGFFPTDHQEYIQIPSLEPKDGHYAVRITEELSEVSYLDQVQLYAIDHPEGEEVYTNERFKSPPFPELRLFSVRRRLYPKSARDGRGHDVLTSLLARDQRYPDEFQRTETGIAELHTIELDFETTGARNALLILNGWVDWPDGSTFRKASQESKAGLVMPYLQVQDASGAWRTVDADMGMPAGKPKTIAVPVQFLSESRKVRIVTNLCVYWDEIFLSEENPGPAMRPVALLSADLRYRGFSESRIDPHRKQPDTFSYDRVRPESFWNPTPGLYTKFGPVEPLLRDVDDQYVIMGSGDELRLTFDAAPPSPGMTRELLLKVDGWAKDRDANTAFGNSVEPLPFHAMSRYPYPGSEQYPRDVAHSSYQRIWNTRAAGVVFAPLN